MAVATKLKDSNANIVLGIVGFNVNANQNRVLKSVADAAGGYYSTASDAQNLTAEFEKMYYYSVFPYTWQALSDSMINQLEVEHKNILSWNKHLADYTDSREENTLQTMINVGSDSDYGVYNKVKGAGLYKYGGKVHDKLNELAKERAEKIKPLYIEKYAELEIQSREYIDSLKRRKGEMVAMIPETSKLNRFTNSDWDYNGGTEDDANKENEKMREEQESQIKKLEKESKEKDGE